MFISEFSLLHPVFLLVLVITAEGYVPGMATNQTVGIPASQNRISNLTLQWYPDGDFTTASVSWRFLRSTSAGTSNGALVHFSDGKVNTSTPPTTTPWIAMVACDSNATSANLDIFTLAHDKGASSVLMYSAYSETCILNPGWDATTSSDGLIDIASLSTLASSRIVQSQFSHISGTVDMYSDYNSQTLNDSKTAVTESITTGRSAVPGFLIASLGSNTVVHKKLKKHTGGIIIGAIIGGFALLFVVSLLVCWIRRREASARSAKGKGHVRSSSQEIPMIATAQTNSNPEGQNPSPLRELAASDHDPTRLEYTRQGLHMTYAGPEDASTSRVVPEIVVSSARNGVYNPFEVDDAGDSSNPAPPSSHTLPLARPPSPTPAIRMTNTPDQASSSGTNEDAERQREVEELRAEIQRLRSVRHASSSGTASVDSELEVNWKQELAALKAEMQELRKVQSANVISDHVPPPQYTEI